MFPQNTLRNTGHIEPFQNALTALNEFYQNTYILGARYLTTSDLTTDRTINGITTTFRQVAQEAAFYIGPSTARFTGTDTQASVDATMNAATVEMTRRLIEYYGIVSSIWIGRGMSFTKASMSIAADATFTDSVKVVRNTCVNTAWPALLSAIKTFVNNTIVTTQSAWNLLLTSPAGRGALARTSAPIVNTLDVLGTTLYGSQSGASGVNPVGFIYNASTSMGSAISGGTIQTVNIASATKDFSTTVNGLTAGTTYFYRAWARNATNISYGYERSFTVAGPPTVTTNAIVRAPTTLTIPGTVTTAPGARIIERGIAWGTTAPTTTTIPTLATKAIDISGNISAFSIALGTSSGLVAGTSYSFVAYAINERGTVAIGTVTTAAFPKAVVLPIPSETAVSKTLTSILVSSENISDFGTVGSISSALDCGFLWSTNQSALNAVTTIPAFSGSAPATGTSGSTEVANVSRVSCAKNNPFTATISGLTFNTTVYFRSYVTHGTDGNSLSTQASGTSLNAVIPTFAAENTTNFYSSSLTGTGVTLTGNISSNGGADITDRGIVYTNSNATPRPTSLGASGITKVAASTLTGTGSYTTSVSGLTKNTQYWYWYYATNAAGTQFTSTKQTINTFADPTISFATSPLTFASGTSVTLTARVTNFGGTGATITAAGFVFSASSNPPTLSDSSSTTTPVPALDTDFSRTISSGLLSGTTYFMRAFATSAAGTGYSSVLDVQMPTVPTLNEGNFNATLANVGLYVNFTGSISSTGSTNIPSVEAGFLYSTNTTAPTSINQSGYTAITIADVTTSTAFTGKNVSTSPFVATTQYYAWVYAKNVVGTTIGTTRIGFRLSQTVTYTEEYRIDYNGNDIGSRQVGKTLDELKTICTNDATCLGFNRGGWMKNTLGNFINYNDPNLTFYIKNFTISISRTTS